MNLFFDSLNVSTLGQHIKSRNPACAPYETVDDWRLVVGGLPLNSKYTNYQNCLYKI